MSRAPLVVPAAATHTATVIFAHGLGDSGHGWFSAVENWRRRQRLDEVKFVLPHAPSIPITCNGGFRMPGWYDITTPASLDGSPEALKRDEDEQGALRSRTYIRDLVQAEIDAGIRADRIVLGGFSQGGAIALFTGLTSSVKLAGIVALSTYVMLSSRLDATYLPRDTIASTPNAGIPIFQGHGTVDPVIPPTLAVLSRDYLRERGYPVEWKTYPMPHSACPEEMDDVEAFLHKVLPPQGDKKSEL